MIEAVRKAVKHIGKEPATQRLTLEEKQALDDIEYSYKRQGIKTSGNEIIRIATNCIVRDFCKRYTDREPLATRKVSHIPKDPLYLKEISSERRKKGVSRGTSR